MFDGEYLNGLRNGKGKEYYGNGKLKFEGEYLNCKRNGKGKEYNHLNGKLLFEGEYLNDLEVIGTKYNYNGNIIHKYNNLNGKGKEYYGHGKLEFEGDYPNGKRNGKGKEYFSNGNLKFEGEYLNGKKWKVKDMIS